MLTPRDSTLGRIHRQLNPRCISVWQHRDLVKEQLLSLLAAGYHPLQMYTTDKKRYYSFAEALAQVDLSLVRPPGPDNPQALDWRVWFYEF